MPFQIGSSHKLLEEATSPPLEIRFLHKVPSKGQARASLARIFRHISQASSSATIGSLRCSLPQFTIVFSVQQNVVLAIWIIEHTLSCPPRPATLHFHRIALALGVSCGFLTPAALRHRCTYRNAQCMLASCVTQNGKITRLEKEPHGKESSILHEHDLCMLGNSLVCGRSTCTRDRR